MATHVGIDIGGTFTDLVAIDDGGDVLVIKCPSTPARPSDAVLEALDRLAASTQLSEISSLVLGTTLATNAVLTRSGARVLYVTTEGFEDVPTLQRADKRDPYDLQGVRPDPFVSRADCLGIRERIDHAGRVRVPLTDAALQALAAEVDRRLSDGDGRPMSIALNLLFSFVNPEHERAAALYLRERFPAIPVASSHEVAPVWREYERASTVIIDAYVKPLLQKFVIGFEEGLRDRHVRVPLAIMKSNGGQMLGETASEHAVQTVLSGLAGGVIAGRYFGQRGRACNVITFDMGGTSTDVGLVVQGQIGYRGQYDLDFYTPVLIPAIDLVTIGAGGGSIAWIDRGGFLKVGPQSAGAVPGPICYGRGGTEPTVTDANLVLGRLDPAFFLGGRMKLDRETATDAVRDLGCRLGLSLEETAQAIVEIANENMANAIRLMTIDRGTDPREFALVAFGGAGPLHAADVAALLGIREVIVPPHPGLTSAFGALIADRRVDRRQTRITRSAPHADPDTIQRLFDGLERQCRDDVRRQGFEGHPDVRRSLSMRYAGQNFELDIPVPDTPLTARSLEQVYANFGRAHAEAFGYHLLGEAIEIVHFNVSCAGSAEAVHALAPDREPGLPGKGQRKAYFRSQGYVETPVYSRARFASNAVITGPAIIEEDDSTTIVHPHQEVRVCDDGLLSVTLPEATARSREIDQVTLAIIYNLMVNTCREMASVMIRTAYSPIFSEARDFSCAIFDADGNMLAQGEGAPAQIGAIRHTVRWTIAEIGPGNFRPGDVVVHNDPYRGGAHMPEHLLLKPIFHGADLIGYAATIGHIAEIGGMAPGSFASTATDIYQEGLRLPPLKLIAEGQYVHDVWRIILTNHRTPRTTWGDLHAMLGSLNAAERRLSILVSKYELDLFREASSSLIDHAERWMREEIREIPDGEYTFQDIMEDDGVTDRPINMRVRVVIDDGRAVVDFTGTDAQARGPVNATYGVTSSATCNAFLQVTDSSIPRNDGVYRPVQLIAPSGTVVNVRHPGPCVGGNTETQPKIALLVLGALGRAIPERISASEGVTSCNFLFGGVHHETGQYYTHYHFEASGWGGRYHTDGNSAQNHIHGNCRVTPVEVFETRFPWHTLCYQLIPDSGGIGRRRGGLGTRRILEAEADEIQVSVFMDHVKEGAWGFRGGGVGRTAGIYVKRADDTEFRTFVEAFGTVSPSKFANVLIRRGDQVMIESAGGGGYEPATEREPDLVLRDVIQGFVSNHAARASYRVALRWENGRLSIDEAETTRLREISVASRGGT
jgi:N-methylhydantoinase A/oxoprolinase/acetone carboxylase beta subunit/N-methylhydantoinase B/oxoprolinase/acetone carboxylase alpha subunit